MDVRDTWLLLISDPDQGRTGIGECAPLPGLSMEHPVTFEERLSEVIGNVEGLLAEGMPMSTNIAKRIPAELPSVRFGLETAITDFANGGSRILFDTDFTRGSLKIPINGLVWMASPDHMMKQVDQKIEQGFRCIKIKIGALDFEQELKVLAYIRKEYGPKNLELRVDANGAYDATQVRQRLQQLSELDIHSIEQPVKPGQRELMATLGDQGLVPIALDEELIGIEGREQKEDLLDEVHPDFIVLKPTLLGGFDACREWIDAAEVRGIGWWITSALESNIGLNSISQFTSTFSPTLHQGLGTGSLYNNNIKSPLWVDNGFLGYLTERGWDLSQLIS